MSARKRIPDEMVISAIQAWRGNVTAAAEALGLAPINLRKRLACLGIDLTLLRRLKDTGIHGTRWNVSVPMTSNGTLSQDGIKTRGRNKSEGGIYPRSAAPTTLARVDADAMMMTRQKAPPPIRLTPDQIEQLRDAKFELQYHLRSEVTESVILQKFFEEKFAAWLKAQLKGEPKAQQAT